jgi:Zeta toxin
MSASPLDVASQLKGGIDISQAPVQPHWYSGMGFTEDTAYLGPFYRVLEAAGSGAAKGEALLAGAGHALYDFREAGAGVRPEDEPPTPALTAWLEQDARERVKAMTPDPATSGTALNLVHGLVSGAYRAVVGSLVAGPAGGAAAVGATEAQSRYQELREAGVSEAAARESAALAGVTSGAGALLPGGWGSNLLTRLATGAAGNAALGAVDRYADHKILAANGFPEMADQQQVWDGAQFAADTFLGAAFGGLAHLHAKSEAEAVQRLQGIQQTANVTGTADAARTLQVSMADRRAAPGIPTTPAAAVAHQAALEQAQTQLLSGQPVNVADSGVSEETYLTRPKSDVLGTQIVSALRKAGIGPEESRLSGLEEALAARLRGEPAPAKPAINAADIPRAAELSPEHRAIESRFADAIATDYEGMKARYAALPESEGGKVLNVDVARELSPDYRRDRSTSAAVHEPASWLVKRMYAERLAQAPGPGEEPTVLFTAGGTGAGKSTAIESVLRDEAKRAQIVMDTNMNGTKSAITKIDQALKAGKEVKIAYVHREPVDALVNGALKRAHRQESELGSGRTVPLEEHVKTHAGANEAIHEIEAHYAQDPRYSLRVIDNTHGPKDARLIDLEKLPSIDYNRTREEASAALEKAYAENRISAAIYRGFAGREPPVREPGAVEREPVASAVHPAGEPAGTTGLGTAAGGQPEPQRGGGRADPLAAPSRQAVEENPHLTIPGDDGTPVSASQALADADRTVQETEKDTPKAITAAVNCFMRRGAA